MNIKELQEQGFSGFVTVRSLKDSIILGRNDNVPMEAGVYLILREAESEPQFVAQGLGGHFKGKDPNVSIAELRNKWVENTNIVYIGQTGATLKKRLKAYMRFGSGMPVGHWGGRYIWQLADADDLIVCWMPVSAESPRDIEKELIQQFKAAHEGRRPFANIVD